MLARRRQEHDKAEDLRRALERRLRLRRLNKDPVLLQDRSALSIVLRTCVRQATQCLPSLVKLVNHSFPAMHWLDHARIQQFGAACSTI